jgi:FtsP/CotA-like multicopper oxidase with cupredoxin domain
MIKLGVLGTATLAVPLERLAAAKQASRIAESRLPKPYATPFTEPPVLQPVHRSATTDFYSMELGATSLEIIPGLRTQVFAYNGTVPGPTIRVDRGRQVKVRHINRLPARHPTRGYPLDTSLHLHGNASAPQFDGYPDDLTRPGQFKDYLYPNNQAARTLWYHDHAAHHTAENVYMGLAGLYETFDAREAALPLPAGRYDVPLVVRDAIFAADGQLFFDDDTRNGLYGDVILVNGRPWPAMKVERRKYRFRILNGSVARNYRWALSTGDPFTVIATDSGLMPAPQRVTSMRHAVAERYEVVIDFAKYRIGQRVELRNLGVKNSRDFGNTGKILAFDVASEPTSLAGNTVPDVLEVTHPVMLAMPTAAMPRRRFEFERHGGEWTINRTTWDDVRRSGYRLTLANPALGATEIWEFANPHGGWNHPVHVHLVDFRILDRNGNPPMAHERGAKDTVFLGENETVRVIATFGPHRGRYLMHCHNTVHEDHDMMAQFQVGPPGSGEDPMRATPARNLPAPGLF